MKGEKMTDQELMAIEKERVQNLLATALAEIDEAGGSTRFFATALLVASFRFYLDVEGVQNLEKAVARLSGEELTRRGKAGSA